MSNKTKYSIISSFIELVEETGLEKITVTDLVDKCNISRQTFYYHFSDVDSMVDWLFEQKTEEICNAFQKDRDYYKAAEETAAFIEKYKKMITIAMNSQKCILVFKTFHKMFSRLMNTYVTTMLKYVKNTDVVITFWANAATSATMNELLKDKPDLLSMYEKINSYLPKAK